MKKRSAFLIPIALLLYSCGLLGQETVKIKIYPEIEKQTIQSVGANYSMARYAPSAWDAIGEQTLREFRPSHVRVALPLLIRKTEYSQYKGEKITDQPLVITILETLKRMKNEFGVSTFIISVWNVADELIIDPEKRNQRVIRPDAYEEVLDMLVAFFLKAKNEYGVEVDYFSFNESDGGWQILFTPAQTIDFIKKAKKRFRDAGLKTKFLLADTAQTLGTVEFAAQILADSTVWDMLGPLSFHSWWSENVPDSEFERVAAFAKAHKKPVWCCETGFNAEAHRVKGMFQSWDYAFRFAKISYRVFRFAESEVSLYWTWQNDYPIMSEDLKTLYPSWYVTRHHVMYLNKGTRIVHSHSSDPEILVLAGIGAGGSGIVHLISVKDKPVKLEIYGFGNGPAELVSTLENEPWKVTRNLSSSGITGLTLDIPPGSVNTVIIPLIP